MVFNPENPLEFALVRASHDSLAAPDFYRLLLESELLVLGTARGQEDAQSRFTLEPGRELQLVVGEENGTRFLPVFSSPARMQDYVKQDSKFLRIQGRALLDLTRGGPVVLNPASEYGKRLSAAEVAQLLDRGKPKVLMGEVNDYPAALVAALVPLFQAHPEVAAAHVIRVTYNDAGEAARPLVGIQVAGDMAALVAEIESIAAAALPGQVFDLQRVDTAHPAGMAKALLKVPPFYVRGRTIFN